jgi:hypothetical protein
MKEGNIVDECAYVYILANGFKKLYTLSLAGERRNTRRASLTVTTCYHNA